MLNVLGSGLPAVHSRCLGKMDGFTTASFYFLTVSGHLVFNSREVEEVVEGSAVQFCHSFLGDVMQSSTQIANSVIESLCF